MYEEGDIAEGPNGATLVFRGGAWVPMGVAAPQPMTLGTPDPTMAYKAPQAAVDLDAARARAAAAAASAPLDQAIKTEQLNNLRNPRSAPPAGYRYKANGDLELIPGGPGKGAGGTGSLDAIVSQINDYSGRYATGVGATSGIRGLGDLLPSDENSALDASGNLLEEIATSAFKVPGMGGQSDADAARLARAYKPDRTDRDAGTRSTLDGLRRRVDFARQAAGLPAANWVSDAPQSVDATVQRYGDTAIPQAQIATGGTRTEADPARAGVAAQVNKMLRSGRPDAEIKSYLASIGAQTNVDAALDFRRKNPSYRGNYDASNLEVRELPLSGAAQTFNRVGAGPVGAYAINAADGFTGGLLDNVTDNPAQTRAVMQGVSAANPTSSLLGTVTGGAVAAGLGELGLARAGVSGVRAALGADAGYGALAGAGSADEGDRALGAIVGGTAGLGGGMFGRALTRRVGNVTRGVRNADVRALANQGVPLTFGQVVGNSGTLGRTIKGIEDRLTGIPGVGDVINARRREGFEGFNRAAFDEGLAPINGSTGGVVREAGIDLARDARSQAYRTALDPVTVRPDYQFASDYAGAVSRGRRLPTDMAARAETNLDFASENFSVPAGGNFFQNGSLSGSGYQQAVRRLRREASANAPLPNGYDFGQVMRQGEDAFEGLLTRQSPQTIPAYQAANAANRNVEVLRDAVNRGRVGTRVGDAGLFAPSQLADAGAANARKFGNSAGTTNQPFFELSRAGQRVLPSAVADSGTTGRWVTAGLLGGAGVGGGYASGDAATGAGITGSGLGLGAALALGGTRQGQRLLTTALLDRTPAMVRLGAEIERRARIGGMFGAASGAGLAGYIGQ